LVSWTNNEVLPVITTCIVVAIEGAHATREDYNDEEEIHGEPGDSLI
jgi:hypothetical protein